MFCFGDTVKTAAGWVWADADAANEWRVAVSGSGHIFGIFCTKIFQFDCDVCINIQYFSQPE